MKMIYQYTKLEVLALILKNKTIRFNNLCNLDDPLEKYLSVTAIKNNRIEDIRKNFGEYCLVSCWTEDSEESIPMWDMYGDRKCGVRIGLPFIGNVEEFFEPVPISISDEKTKQRKIETTSGFFYPEYIAIEYKRFVKKKPVIKKKDSENRYIWFEELGKYKIPDWSFQNEKRFRIFCGKQNDSKKECRFLPKMFPNSEKANLDKPKTEFIDLKLKDDVISNMKILAGPDMSDGDRILLDALMNFYNMKADNSKFLSRRS